jgi:hypothetical protein
MKECQLGRFRRQLAIALLIIVNVMVLPPNWTLYRCLLSLSAGLLVWPCMEDRWGLFTQYLRSSVQRFRCGRLVAAKVQRVPCEAKDACIETVGAQGSVAPTSNQLSAVSASVLPQSFGPVVGTNAPGELGSAWTQTVAVMDFAAPESSEFETVLPMTQLPPVASTTDGTGSIPGTSSSPSRRQRKKKALAANLKVTNAIGGTSGVPDGETAIEDYLDIHPAADGEEIGYDVAGRCSAELFSPDEKDMGVVNEVASCKLWDPLASSDDTGDRQHARLLLLLAEEIANAKPCKNNLAAKCLFLSQGRKTAEPPVADPHACISSESPKPDECAQPTRPLVASACCGTQSMTLWDPLADASETATRERLQRQHARLLLLLPGALTEARIDSKILPAMWLTCSAKAAGGG